MTDRANRRKVAWLSGYGPLSVMPAGYVTVPSVARVVSRGEGRASARCPRCRREHEVLLGEEESVSVPFGCVASRRMAVAVARDEAGARRQ